LLTGNSLGRIGQKKSPPDDEIKKLFITYTCLGPVARTCLKSIDIRNDREYRRTLDVYLRRVDIEIRNFIARGGRETLEHTIYHESSHKIAVMQPTTTGLSYKARMITRWISSRVYQIALKRSQQDCFVLFKHLSSQKRLRSAAGTFFESYVHDWFRLGGAFTAVEIASTNRSQSFRFKTMRSKSCTPNYFTDAESLSLQVKADGQGLKPSIIEEYFIPFNLNYEAFDGLVFSDLHTIVLFQVTIAKQHSIKGHGIKKLLKELPKTIKRVHVVLVVPENCESEYSRAQNIPDAAAITPPGACLNIKQFRLVFHDKDIQKVVVQGPFEMQEEEDEEEDEDDADSGWC